jgi:hypothetical protein
VNHSSRAAWTLKGFGVVTNCDQKLTESTKEAVPKWKRKLNLKVLKWNCMKKGRSGPEMEAQNEGCLFN